MKENDIYLFYDKPVPYKKLLIYPALMEEYIEFHTYVQCLLYEKNSIPDARIISMSYLRFLYYLAGEKNEPSVYFLNLLLAKVLHLGLEDIKFYVGENDRAFFEIKGEVYDANDFDKISQIICEQNSIMQIDNTIRKEIRDAMKKAQEYKMQQNKNKMCSLEEQMICVLISTSLTLEDIYKLTIRKFSKILERIDCKMHYEIYLSASLSGMVKFNNDDAIKHWMSDLTKTDIYSDVKIDENAMQQKIDGINNPKGN